jgi:hypothetical protein
MDPFFAVLKLSVQNGPTFIILFQKNIICLFFIDIQLKTAKPKHVV